MTLHINEGDHPSLLDIDRHLTGELHDPTVEAWLSTPEGSAYQLELEEGRSRVGPFDFNALRARTASIPSSGSANNTRSFLALVLMVAAAALFAALPLLSHTPSIAPDYVGLRGSSMELFHLESGALRPYDERALGRGDVLGFKVDPGARTGVVLLSIDASGEISVYYPMSGDQPEPVSGPASLPGSITLDDAPGPEIFVTVFGENVSTARAQVERAWQAAGVQGVIEWADHQGNCDAAVVTRR